MLDGLLLEEDGIPAAVVCTQPFVQTARAMAATRGVPDYPFALCAHPISNRTPGELRLLAESVADRVVDLILRPVAPA